MASPAARRSTLGVWVRSALGVAGLIGLWLIVDSVGVEVVLATLRPALAWLPLLCLLELGRMASETLAAYIAFGARAQRIPLATLFRANVIGQAIANLAPAPRVVNETIKATLLAPHVGAAAAASVGFTIQAATLISVGLFSIPCGLAIYARGGAGVWFWAAVIHAIVLVTTGIALRAMARAHGMGAWLARKLPKIAAQTAAFGEQSREVGVWAGGPTLALMGNRIFQSFELAVAAYASGIDTGFVQALAAQGVNLVAAAVGVLVPGGLGTTDGAFTLAAEMLGTNAAKATSLALLLRCTQLIWLLVGSALLIAIPRRHVAPDES